MKKLFLFAISFLLILSCHKEKKESGLNYLSTNLGGCFSGKKSAMTSGDTVYFQISHDTLTMNTGLSYNCCGKLNYSVSTSDTQITLQINDTCTVQCQCNCTCYYTFESAFKIINPATYSFKVLLKEYQSKDYQVHMEGTLTIK